MRPHATSTPRSNKWRNRSGSSAALPGLPEPRSHVWIAPGPCGIVGIARLAGQRFASVRGAPRACAREDRLKFAGTEPPAGASGKVPKSASRWVSRGAPCDAIEAHRRSRRPMFRAPIRRRRCRARRRPLYDCLWLRPTTSSPASTRRAARVTGLTTPAAARTRRLSRARGQPTVRALLRPQRPGGRR